MPEKKFQPINFQINTLEQLEIMFCALEEFTDADNETQWQAKCLADRLEAYYRLYYPTN